MSLVTKNTTKICFGFLVEAHKTIYGTGTPVPKKLMKMFHLSSAGMMGPRGASLCSIIEQTPRGALFRWDLAWAGN